MDGLARPRAARRAQTESTLKPRNRKRLAQDLARAYPRGAAISHAECEELLPWYLRDEQHGAKMARRYPLVWAHLQNCARCTLSLDLLRTTARAAPPTTRPQPPIPFLQNEPVETWRQETLPQWLGARAQFQLNAGLVRKVFNHATVAGLRRTEGGAEEENLLFADEMILGDQHIQVEAALIPTADTRTTNLRLALVAETPLPESLLAHLDWGARQQVKPIEHGSAIFENISARELESLTEPNPTVRVTFEVAPNAPHAQPSRRHRPRARAKK